MAALILSVSYFHTPESRGHQESFPVLQLYRISANLCSLLGSFRKKTHYVDMQYSCPFNTLQGIPYHLLWQPHCYTGYHSSVLDMNFCSSDAACLSAHCQKILWFVMLDFQKAERAFFWGICSLSTRLQKFSDLSTFENLVHNRYATSHHVSHHVTHMYAGPNRHKVINTGWLSQHSFQCWSRKWNKNHGSWGQLSKLVVSILCHCAGNQG